MSEDVTPLANPRTYPQIILVLSEEAAMVVRYGVENMTKKSQGKIGPEIIAEIDAQRGHKPEKFIPIEPPTSVQRSKRTPAPKPDRAKKIADAMAKATKEAVEDAS
jgi:hypothetical protein